MPLPTRVLEILKSGDLIKVKLVEGAGRDRHYTALSYCWGKPEVHHVLKTTTANLTKHGEGIEFRSLPQTLQDAVQITSGLGFNFLWIDALCIIQDDEDDWSREAATMCQVYSNAALTLIASGSSGSSEGIFRYQSYSKARKLAYKDTFVYVRPDLAREHSPFGIDDGWPWNDEPLSKRAWTLQEAVLSNRVLSFTRQELKWLCNEWRKCECASLCSPMDKEDFEDPRAFRLRSLFGRQDLTDAYRRWADIVMMFSKRQLSFDKDRLTALSGIAQRFASLLLDCYGQHDTYYAGLWERHLPEALLWKTDDYSKVQFSSAELHCRRPNLWRAPTWSWAALEAPILYPPYIGLQYRVKVIRCSTSTRDIDPYGQVQSGTLKLVGVVLHGISIEVISTGGAESPNLHGNPLIGSINTFKRDDTHMLKIQNLGLCYFTPDCVADLTGGTGDVSAVVVGYQKVANELLMLVLRKVTGGSFEFERLGLARYRPNEMQHRLSISQIVDAAQEEEIVVV